MAGNAADEPVTREELMAPIEFQRIADAVESDRMLRSRKLIRRKGAHWSCGSERKCGGTRQVARYSGERDYATASRRTRRVTGGRGYYESPDAVSGARRVLFGADYPPFRYERLVSDWRGLGYDDPILERVFFRNAEALFAA